MRKQRMSKTNALAACSMGILALATCSAPQQPAQRSAPDTVAGDTAAAASGDGVAGDDTPAPVEPGAAAGQPKIPRGAAPTLDGSLGGDEWSDAASATIQVEDGWDIAIRYKRDADNLYVAFSNLRPAEDKELYPEILVDVQGDASATWAADDWWIHISYNDCESQGRPNVWQCAKSKEGWSANNFPVPVPGVVEAQIAWQKLGLDPEKNRTVGLAFDVTDTRKDYYFWPAGAALDSPATWARVEFEP